MLGNTSVMVFTYPCQMFSTLKTSSLSYVDKLSRSDTVYFRSLILFCSDLRLYMRHDQTTKIFASCIFFSYNKNWYSSVLIMEWAANMVKNWWNTIIFMEHIKMEERTVIIVKTNSLNHEINNWTENKQTIVKRTIIATERTITNAKRSPLQNEHEWKRRLMAI